jgi:uncharacterized Zn-finger protein
MANLNIQLPDIFLEGASKNKNFLCNYCQTALGLSDKTQEISV